MGTAIMIAKDTKAELALHALMYVVKQTAIDNIKVPLSLGLTEWQANELLTLNNQELHEMAILANLNILKVEFDQEALDIALKINDKKSLRRQEIFRMLKAGASYCVMNALYGLTRANIGSYRKMVNLSVEESKGGRPSNPTEQEENELWELMKPAQDFNDPNLSKLLLNANEKTGVKISTIWVMLNKFWEEEERERNVQ
jgi:hypothetical protein